MCGWTKKRGSMKAVVLMATPFPKSLHDKAEKWIAQRCAGPGLATADDCDDGEEVSRVRLRYPKHLMSCTIALAHTLTPSHTVRCLDRDTAGDYIGSCTLRVKVAESKAAGRACAGVCARTLSDTLSATERDVGT